MMRFIIVYILFAAVGVVITTHRDAAIPTNRSLKEFPEQVQSWHMSKRGEFSDNILNVLKPTDYLSRQYQSADGKVVNLYVGYHGGGKKGGEIHSPKHCLPGSGWYEVSTQRGKLAAPGTTINLVRATYQKGDSQELFLYWFQVRDRSVSNEYFLKAAQILNSILHNRRDATFIRISIPVVSDVTQANSTGEQFVRDFSPHFKEFLPH